MCGITGVLDQSSPRGEDTVATLNSFQTHRGPDDAVVVRAGPFVLGNTRLAIQDPTPAGNQPFESADGRFCAVFNGEIYNFRELAREFGLELAGHCDGAVIPELWSRLGVDCLPLLHGMFAIAIADREAKVLTLVRDPFGIKPLYWRAMPDGIAFASEPRALAGLRSRPGIRQEAVACFLRLGAVAADMSPFEDIEAVAPNQVVLFDDRGHAQRRLLLSGPAPLLRGSDEKDDGDVGALFRRSVELHLRADVPTALLLSGGVDSAAVASAARTLGLPLRCMTVAGLAAAEPALPTAVAGDEAGAAAKTARHYGHEHHVIPAELDDDAVRSFFAAMQRPTIDGLNTFLVSRAVHAAGYKVALSGLGGDEALGGYRHFRIARAVRALRLVDALPSQAPRMAVAAARRVRAGFNWPKIEGLLLARGQRSPWQLDLAVREVLPSHLVRALTGIDPDTVPILASPPDGTDLGPFEGLVASEIALYLQTVLLPDADAFSMRASVELRVPFLDRPFFAAAVRATAQAPGYRGKRMLAQALHDDFLTEIAGRPKQGFTVPMAEWMRSGLLAPAVDALWSPSAPIWDHVDRATAQPLVVSLTSAHGRWSPLWSLAVLNGWLESLADPGFRAPQDEARL